MSFNKKNSNGCHIWSKKYQGKQLADYATFQYTRHIYRFVDYLRHDTEMSNLMRIQTNQYHQIVGTHWYFWEVECTACLYGERSRIFYLLKQNIKWEDKLLIKRSRNQELVRENDVRYANHLDRHKY